jgi:uncharacterized protein (TIGR02594 family)
MAGLNTISKSYWKAVQQALKDHGFDPGAIDGKRGAKTDGSLGKFKASRGLIPRPYIGPITLEKLSAPVVSPSTGGWPNWLKGAYKYLGLKEIPGSRDNPQIVAWWQDIGAGWFDDDETPWCGAFVGGTLLEAEIDILPGAKAPRARAWEKWGQKLDGPAIGAVVTFSRRSGGPGAGHVAFVLGQKGGRIVCLGGNQSNAVTVANFATSRITSYRWPSSVPTPTTVSSVAGLPTVTEEGHISIDEQ